MCLSPATTLPRYSTSVGRDHSKLRTYLDLFRYFKNNRELARREVQEVFLQGVSTAHKYLKRPLTELRVLEIGHGQHATITTLFHSSGARATGIDMDYVVYGYSPRKYWNIFRNNGLERAIKTLGRNILFDPAYYRTVRHYFGRPLKTKDVDLRRMNAARMQFGNSTFDFVFSNAVFEHIADVDAAAREIARVLGSHGVANISIDVFPSLSGGHNLDWVQPDQRQSKRVPAWDHLRDNKYPTHVYLNRLRVPEYLQIFRRYFDILEQQTVTEGTEVLTPQLERELTAKGYTRDDLLTRTVRVVLRPKR